MSWIKGLGLVLKLLDQNLHYRSWTLNLINTHAIILETIWPKSWDSEIRKTFTENKSTGLIKGMVCSHVPS